MIPSLSEAELKLFRYLIRKHVGISFARQKTGALQRKLAGRLNHLGLKSYGAYYRYLVHNEAGGWELRELINSITVEQTDFFRHVRQFELLADIALPQIARRNAATKKVRIWSAGCATGEEAYSIAMVVRALFHGDDTWDIKILATDVDTKALKTAYRGQYSRGSTRNIPPEYLNKYFTKDVETGKEFYTVKEELRKNLLFRRLNFMQPAYSFRSAVDILFCRNVMIYFDPKIRRRLIDNFFHILAPDGFLFLGGSESLLGTDDRFSLIGHSAYQKTT